MNTLNITIYGIDCTVHKTLPDIEQVLKQARRSDPDLIVFYAPFVPTEGFLDIVRDTYAAGCAVMLTPNKPTAPSDTNWLENLAG